MNNLPFYPTPASDFAARFDVLFLTLLGLTVLFGGGVIFFAVYWAVKYRAGSSAHRKRPEHESRGLETILMGVPLILGLVIFVWGFRDYAAQRTIPANAIEVFVLGKQWMWHIQHSDGAREMDNLTIPVGQPVRLTMISQDVIHEFFVPAFRVQFQVIPGRYTAEWFTPTRIGRYVFLCNQYCGMDHSRMFGHVDVVSQADYQRWLSAHERPGVPTGRPLFQAGRDLFQSQSCVSCHGPADTAQGPSLLGIYGKTVPLAAGGAAQADDNFLRRKIVAPSLQIAKGYGNSMPSYSEMDEGQLWALVVYLRSLTKPTQLPPNTPTAPALTP